MVDSQDVSDLMLGTNGSRANEEAELAYQQALKYGEDLRRVYMAEKVRRRELEMTLQTLNAVLDSTPNGLAVLNETFAIQEVNREFAKLMERTESDLLGEPIDSILPQTLLMALQQASQGQATDHVLMEIQVENPVHRVLQTSFSRLMVGDQRGWVVSIEDITEHRQLTFQKLEFINIAAHELRTPLTQIIGHASMLKEELELTEEEIYLYVEGIIEGTWRLKERIDELMRFASILGGSDQPRALTSIDLFGLINALLDDQMSGTPAPRDLQIAIENDAPLHILTDARLLGSALAEILANAIRFNSPGGEIAISAERADHQVTITVQDTGIGIPQSDLERVFEPFYQVEDHRTRRVGGLGLGLCIANQAIQNMGGTFILNSTLNEGTTAIVTIPDPL